MYPRCQLYLGFYFKKLYVFQVFTMPIIRSRVSLNKSQHTVVSHLADLCVLKYDVGNHEPKIAWHVSSYKWLETRWCCITIRFRYAIRRVQVIQDGFKLHGTYQFWFMPTILINWANVHTVKENAEALAMTSKETGLEVNADKTEYMVMYWDQTAGRSYSMKIDNGSSERVVEFTYLGTTLMNQNSIQEEIKSILKSANACYYSVRIFCFLVCYPKI
jgi:hypothetical protein